MVAGLPESESHHTSTDSGALTGQTIESDPRSISYSSSTDINCSSRSSCDTWTGSSSGSKPHKANDAGWEAIRSVKSKNGNHLGLAHFRLMHKLGSGDIGSVYLTELRGTDCYFAMKVMDKKALTSRNKLLRAQTEREILEVLDHPFLPTLYAHLDTPQFSCLVMEFCPGGDLHVLRQRQPGKRFSEHAARFYASEVLLSLEYLHMMGIIYRDLKPENVLVREDGHIMLTDFDLSLKCSVHPTLLRSSPASLARAMAESTLNDRPPPASSCILPACVLPCTTQQQRPIVSCLPMFHHFSRKKSRPKQPPLRRSDLRSNSASAIALPELLAEPTDARSMSFVGTHEYLAPEIIVGEGHGSAVDWWTFGIFLFELLYGKTPFRGSDNEKTLANVVSQPLEFPSDVDSDASNAAKDLIRALLVKDPSKRMASSRGATEIKQHAFFAGVNWALIRCSIPPEIPSPFNPPPHCRNATQSDPPEEEEGDDDDQDDGDEEDDRPSGANFKGKGSSDFEYF